MLLHSLDGTHWQRRQCRSAPHWSRGFRGLGDTYLNCCAVSAGIVLLVRQRSSVKPRSYRERCSGCPILPRRFHPCPAEGPLCRLHPTAPVGTEPPERRDLEGRLGATGRSGPIGMAGDRAPAGRDRALQSVVDRRLDSLRNLSWGEKYAEAARVTGYDVASLRNMAWVASHFDLSLRSDKLAWSHHVLLAPLEPDEQRHWLERASEERLSVADLRVELRALRDGGKRESADDASTASASDRDAVVCPRCGHKLRPRGGVGRVHVADAVLASKGSVPRSLERLELLCDPGSFAADPLERSSSPRLGPRAGLATGSWPGSAASTGARSPATRRTPASSAAPSARRMRTRSIACCGWPGARDLPVVSFIESGGARMQEGTAALGGYGRIFRRTRCSRASSRKSRSSVGWQRAAAATRRRLTDFVVMTEEATMFLTGPGRGPRGDRRGDRHGASSAGPGCTSATASATSSPPSDHAATDLARALLGYLPQHAGGELPLTVAADPELQDPASCVPRSPRQVYDVRDGLRRPSSTPARCWRSRPAGRAAS